MTDIRAFIGHSFSPEDEPTIAVLLKYLDQVQGILPSFSWVHAEAAQPRELAEKVLSLIGECNAFIGVCTRRERVIDQANLLPHFLRPDRVQAPLRDFEWKTSDWLIQEIGLARGRGMALVLLLEDGCRKPGGLQGDVEFIPFNRAAPEKAFGKLLEMLKALAPPVVSAGTAAQRELPAESTGDVAESDDRKPDPSWDRDEYSYEYFRRLMRRDHTESEIDAAYLSTPEGKDPEKRAEWTAITEYSNTIMSHSDGSLERIRQAARDYPSNVTILSQLAHVLRNLESHLEAAATYERAAGVAVDPSEVGRYHELASVQFVMADRADLAEPILNSRRELVRSDSTLETPFLKTMQQIAEFTRDEDLAIGAMERMMELHPDDFGTRFTLAYKHSEIDNNDLALHHYLQIPYERRSAITWNNLGVAHQQFGMPGKAVSAYRKSADAGETLAMSNIANVLMRAGFVAAAEVELDKALRIENFHRNVGEAVTTLRDIPGQENEKLRDTLDRAKRKVEFFQRLGRAIGQPPALVVATTWRGPDCDITVSVQGDKFTGVGDYEMPRNALASAFTPPKPVRRRVEYSGRIVGRRVDGQVRRTNDESPQAQSLLGLGLSDVSTKFALVIEAEGRRMSVIENPSSAAPQTYELEAL